jgi:hypothetical protein
MFERPKDRQRARQNERPNVNERAKQLKSPIDLERRSEENEDGLGEVEAREQH